MAVMISHPGTFRVRSILCPSVYPKFELIAKIGLSAQPQSTNFAIDHFSKEIICGFLKSPLNRFHCCVERTRVPLC